jgi:hypothetical protein
MLATERYPLAVCARHYSECLDGDGNRVEFVNEGMWGGFVSHHHIGGEVVMRSDPNCFVRGVKCSAGEARYGGIVIQMDVCAQ